MVSKISGKGFLWAARDRKPFMDAGLPVGISIDLSILSLEIKEGGEFVPWR